MDHPRGCGGNMLLGKPLVADPGQPPQAQGRQLVNPHPRYVAGTASASWGRRRVRRPAAVDTAHAHRTTPASAGTTSRMALWSPWYAE